MHKIKNEKMGIPALISFNVLDQTGSDIRCWKFFPMKQPLWVDINLLLSMASVSYCTLEAWCTK